MIIKEKFNLSFSLIFSDGNREILVPHKKYTELQKRSEMQREEVSYYTATCF